MYTGSWSRKLGPSELGRPILLFMIICFILSYFEWFISRLHEQRHKNKVKLHVNNTKKQLNASQIIDVIVNPHER